MRQYKKNRHRSFWSQCLKGETDSEAIFPFLGTTGPASKRSENRKECNMPQMGTVSGREYYLIITRQTLTVRRWCQVSKRPDTWKVCIDQKFLKEAFGRSRNFLLTNLTYSDTYVHTIIVTKLPSEGQTNKAGGRKKVTIVTKIFPEKSCHLDIQKRARGRKNKIAHFYCHSFHVFIQQLRTETHTTRPVATKFDCTCLLSSVIKNTYWYSNNVTEKQVIQRNRPVAANYGNHISLLQQLLMPPLGTWGGSGGGGGNSGRWEKEGTERRKRATSSGRSHMSPTERSVGLAGQLKRCGTEWQDAKVGAGTLGHSLDVGERVKWVSKVTPRSFGDQQRGKVLPLQDTEGSSLDWCVSEVNRVQLLLLTETRRP